VIVPVHQSSAAFHRCLRDIHASAHAPREVIVVVDGATAEPARLAGHFGMRVLATGARRGPAAARNLGALVARGDVLFFLDADVAMPPSAIAEVAQAFRDHPEVGALIGSYDDAPAAPNFLSQYKNLLHHYVHQHAREEGYTFWGAAGAIRRDLFLELGGYDEKYRYPSIEDIELGYRVKAAGHRIRVCKALQVMHLKRWGPWSLFQSDFFRRALPWTELILSTGGFENDLNIDRASRVKVALVYCLLGALGLSWWRPGALILAALIAAALVVLDVPLLRFFRRKRGTWFALRTVPWHWFYYLYSGLGFAVGLGAHVLRGRPRRDQQPVRLEPQPLPPDAAWEKGA
jgi:GT2 family glycosyltransferase